MVSFVVISGVLGGCYLVNLWVSMLDSIIWWTGAVVIFLSSFCLIICVLAVLIQSSLNYLWRKLKLISGMSELQKAWRFYEKNKESSND